MNTDFYTEELPMLKAAKDQPAVSIIMPFEPKMGSKAKLKYSLKLALDKVKHELSANYTEEAARLVMDKLQSAMESLDYRTHKKSIAIYVSPLVEKVYYLDITVKEKIMVDRSFEVRDLVLNKKEEHAFLLLIISAKKEKIFIGNEEKITPVVSNDIIHTLRDLPEPVANFSDRKAVKEIKLKNFLKYIDNNLSIILNAYPLPLFVMTTEKTMGYFMQITKHYQYITGFIHGNFENASEHELWEAIHPHLENWKSVKQKDVLNRLSVAQNDFKLASGIDDVWKQACRKQGRLLVVEKDFFCPAHLEANGGAVFNGSAEDVFQLKDAVDDIIEKVLDSGGDVEFVDELKDYNHIALIEYYH